jgi:phosphoglycerate kinase
MHLPALHEGDFSGKRVFVRVDYNVPLQEGIIQDDRRIRASLPTLRYLLERGASLVLASHLGRPKGAPDPKYSLAPIAAHLSTLLDRSVQFVSDWNNPLPYAPGQVVLLENLRFHPGETKNDPDFARLLAGWADVYVCDAFGSVHRAHASVEALPRRFAHRYAGLLLLAEWENAQRVLSNITHPYLLIIGGAKVADKLPVLNNLLDKIDRLLIGGGMSYTFLKAQGLPIGKSLCEEEHLETARAILQTLEKQGKKFLLPLDSVAAPHFAAEAPARVFPHESGHFPDEYMGLDIGPQTIAAAQTLIQGAKTILWNGPMGVFEWKTFQTGTLRIAQLVAEETQAGAYSLIGGGDTASAIEMLGLSDKVSFVSTGGGALLELLSGQTLPGIAALLS